jgi:asparagine synthase (glutamine-hydrolysing)
MCGISGYISVKNDRARVDEILRAFISARGPDGAGCWNGANGEIVVYHSRLSIIDLTEAGSQPMTDSESGWVISFNGEIYNYIEIRKELEVLGRCFRGNSDTEVLLQAWAEWGVESLHRLNGMFAFAILHPKTKQMWLVRDRFGVKPLIWASTKCGGFIFSSSVAAVAKILGADVNVPSCAFGLYFKVFETADTQATFHGIQAVQPGGWLHVRQTAQGLTVKQGAWYSLKEAVDKQVNLSYCYTDLELLARCSELLTSAINVRLRSDVPLAVSLSGGLDSTTIATIASKKIRGLEGFTYGSSSAASSEGPDVERFAEAVGINVQYIWPDLNTKVIGEILDRTLASQEAPFPSLSVMAQNEVFRAVKLSGFKVLLGGQGGDEIFAGYRKFFFIAAREIFRTREFLKAFDIVFSLGLMLFSELNAAPVYLGAINRYVASSNRRFRLLSWAVPDANLWGDSKSDLVSRQVEDILRWSIPSLLRYEDRNSMGYGVESRLPFMDYRLVEFAIALPWRLKINNGYGKWALRQIGEGLVPDFIRLKRRKRGFDVSQKWIKNGLGEILRERIDGCRGAVSQHLRLGVDIGVHLSDTALNSDSNLLDEALMLAWLAEPIRSKTANIAI